MGLRQRVFSGVFWVAISSASIQMIGFVSSIVLARLLTPQEFGLIDIVMVFVSVSTILGEFGIGQALIRWQGDVREAVQTAFLFNVGLTIAIALVLFGLSPSVAAFYRAPSATPVLRALTPMIVLAGLQRSDQYVLILGLISSAYVQPLAHQFVRCLETFLICQEFDVLLARSARLVEYPGAASSTSRVVPRQVQRFSQGPALVEGEYAGAIARRWRGQRLEWGNIRRIVKSNERSGKSYSLNKRTIVWLHGYFFPSAFSTSMVHSVTRAATAATAASTGASIMPSATTGTPTVSGISNRVFSLCMRRILVILPWWMSCLTLSTSSFAVTVNFSFMDMLRPPVA